MERRFIVIWINLNVNADRTFSGIQCICSIIIWIVHPPISLTCILPWGDRPTFRQDMYVVVVIIIIKVGLIKGIQIYKKRRQQEYK